MAPERSCTATKANGEPCGAPSSMVDPETGRCPAHAPGASERLSEAGRKGGKALARKHARGGLDEDELPELHTPKDAARLLEAVVRATVTGRLGHHEAKAAVRGVREWLRAHESGEVSETLDDLLSALERWRETGDEGPVLEVIEGRGP